MPSLPETVKALDLNPTPSLGLDEEGVVTFLNRAAVALLGSGSRERIQGPWSEMLRPSERQRAQRQLMDPNGTLAGPWEFADESGNPLLCHVTALPIQAAGGGGSILFLHDARAEDEVVASVRAHEKSFRQLASSVPGALSEYELFPDGTELVHYMSSGCFDLWELEAEEVENHAARLWEMVHEDDLEAMQASVVESAEGLTPWTHEWRITTPSGVKKWIEGTARPTLQPGGSILWQAFMLDVTERKLHDEHQASLLRRSSEQLRSLAGQLQTVREEERTEVARELHDEVGQYLTVMTLDLHEIERCETEGASIEAPREHLKQMLAETLEVVQRMTERLRPPLFEFRGLGPIIATHVASRLQIDGGVQFHVDISAGDRPSRSLRSDRALALFRVFQESATNVLRHSKANEAWVRLGADGNTLILEIEDDGVGITEEEIQDPLSMGLTGMRERMHAIDGTFSIRQGARGGVLTRATLDLAAQPTLDLREA